MNPLTQFKTITLPILIWLVFVCLGLSPRAQAVLPPPDGGYQGQNTAEGAGALGSLSLGKGGPSAVKNTALGFDTLFNDTGGNANTAIGASALFTNITGKFNTVTGTEALFHNTVDGNTANGYQALYSNTIGDGNSATGYRALYNNTSGIQNTATGFGALYHNTADGNTADGYQALFSNTTGSDNVAMGYQALQNNTDGGGNTAVGFQASQFLTGSANTAVGWASLLLTAGKSNTAMGYQAGNSLYGSGNTAIGDSSLFGFFGNDNTGVGNNAMNGLERSGSNNTAIGAFAFGSSSFIGGATGNDNTAIDWGTLISNHGNSNTAVGANAGTNITTASHVICVGADLPAADVSNSCYVGNIWNQSGGSQAVYVNSQGKLGVQTSSRRFKDEIKPMEQASEVIYALKPVSFRYKKEIEPTRPLGFGLIAEEVEKASPDLVGRGGDGKANTVRYDAVNAMLLNEFLKEHRKVQEQDSKLEKQARKIQEQERAITQLRKGMETVVARLKEQDSKIEKVSAQIETRKPAPQVVNNNQ
jgi:trimeric autotransporter adhesin